jgi:ABC-type polysaccharide/polyol phosphate export permease
LIAFTLAIAIAWFFRGSLNPVALLSLIPAFVLLFFLGWALALLSGILHTHFPDTQHVLELGLQFLFYLTPIVYKVESLHDRTHLGWVVDCNPMTSLLVLFRAPVLDGRPPDVLAISVSVGFLLIAGVLAIALLRKLERNLVFWI